MTKDEALVWAQNNCGTEAYVIPLNLPNEPHEVITAFLRGVYASQDAGLVTLLECRYYAFACGIQNLWKILGVSTDRVTPFKKPERSVVRPECIEDEMKTREILIHEQD